MNRVVETGRVISQDKILLPTADVLEEASNRSSKVFARPIATSTKNIQDLFPEQEHEEKSIKKAKEILGPLAGEFSKIELRELVAQVEYLVETWLDEFERDIFKGMTLKELLHERGGL